MLADILVGCMAVFFVGLLIYKLCRSRKTCGGCKGCTGNCGGCKGRTRK